MFRAIYKTTYKNLLRSPTFWLAFFVLCFVGIETALRGFHTMYDFSLKEEIADTDPRYILEYDVFVQWLNNAVTSLLLYIAPIFSVAITVIILNRDYKDDFFEIEKAAGIKPFQYIFARLTAMIIFGYLFIAAINFLQVNLYVFTRGGVNGIGNQDYFIENIVRLGRIQIARILPCAVFYTAFTYFVGALFKNYVVSAVAGFGYAIFNYAVVLYSVREIGTFLNYCSPIATKLKNYMHLYDTEKFESFIKTTDTSLQDAMICISVLIGLGLVFGILCHILTCRRTK